MEYCAALLKDFLKQHCLRAWEQDVSSDVRPFLRGLPEALAHELFKLLTDGGERDFKVADQKAPLPVILIDTKGYTSSRGAGVLSGVANWDYAITVRNSVSSFVCIATPSALMTEQQSMSNTTEPFEFGPSSRGEPAWNRVPWSNVLKSVEVGLGLDDRQSGSLVPLLEASWAFATEDSPVDRLINTWGVIDRWLGYSGRGGIELLKSAGFPMPESRTISFAEAQRAAKQLGDLAKRAGQEKSYHTFEENLLEGASKLPSERVKEVECAIRKFVEHLKKGTAVTISEFSASPAVAYGEAAGAGDWWEVLTSETWEKVLQPVARGPVFVTISVTNRIDTITDKSLPAIVVDQVHLECIVEADENYKLLLERSVGRKAAKSFDIAINEPVVDEEVPSHSLELVYKATLIDGDTTKQTKLSVISLAHFEPGMLFRIEGMVSSKVQRDADLGHFLQEVALDGSGHKDFVLYVSDEIERVCITSAECSGDAPSEEELRPLEESWQHVSGNAVYWPGYQIEEDTYLRIWRKDIDDIAVPVLDVLLTIPPEEYRVGGLPCLVSSLVATHQGVIKSVDKAAIVPPCETIERFEQLILDQSPYRPVLACWRESDEVHERQAMDFENGKLGLASPGLLRPVLEHLPAPIQQARDTLVDEIKNQRRPLRQVDFTGDGIGAACDRYLAEYLAWLKQDPAAASWLDLVACYAGPANGSTVATSTGTEPHVLLMSPLHPLKIAFNAKCQILLQEGSKRDRCPLAGYLDPHAIPGSLKLNIASQDGESPIPRVFLNAGSTDPFWTIFWSSEVFPRDQKDPVLLGVLERLRLLRPGLHSGFSESLVQKAMREVEDLTPARSVFQIGLQGSSLSSGTCAKAILGWCAERSSLTRQYAVFDRRVEPSVPTDQALAYVAAEKPGAVRWFGKGADRRSLDILVVDDLETRDWGMMPREDYEAVVAPNGLFRFQTRADQSNGMIVQVAYAINPREEAYGRSNELKAAALLEGECLEAGKAHYRFSPNTQEIYNGLDTADFVTVTSRDVDPACFMHGAGFNGGVLWDYELPTLTGMTSSSVGYYLVAKPRPAMISSVEAAVGLLVTDTTEASELTKIIGKEIAARGMPILRRLGGGGSQARGELGVLLTLRALQGKVNERGGSSCLPLHTDGEINLLIAVDPYWEVFEQVRKTLDQGSSFERPDILVISILPRDGEGRTRLRVTPLEVKFRSQQMSPADLGKALQQASNLGSLLEKIWGLNCRTELWTLSGRNLLASCIEHGFRVGATSNAHGLKASEWAKLQAHVILDVLTGDAEVNINATGRLIAFDNREETKTFSLGQASEIDTMTVGRGDAIELLKDSIDQSSPIFAGVERLDFRCRHWNGASRPENAPPKVAKPLQGDTEVGPSEGQRPASTNRGGDEPPTSVDNRVGPARDDELESSSSGSSRGSNTSTAGVGTRAANHISSEARERVECAFDGFVGNDNAVSTIKRDLLYASLQDPPALSETYLLSGPPSTGKTELSRRIAKALGLPFVALDGKAVDSRDKLFSYIRSKLEEAGEQIVDLGMDAGRPVRSYPPFVVLIDEVHLVRRSVQEAMLTLLEANDRKVTLKDEYAIVKTATFLFATTRPSDLDGAFKTRCREIPLRPYTVAQVAEMLRRVVEKEALFGDQEDLSAILTDLAAVGRSVPRIALQILSELKREMIVSGEPDKPASEHLLEVMKSRGVDEKGIGRRDLDVLEFLEWQANPIGEDRMLSMLHTVDKDTVLEEIDPFLQKLGYVAHDRSGRTITQKGRDYLFERRIREQG
jgi:Holliday junction resolvasome RuvABC ATP-dependent DNA helicase subunit